MATRRILFIALVLGFSCMTTGLSYGTANPPAEEEFDWNEEEIEERIKQLDISVDSRYTSAVKSYITNYFVKDRKKASDIIGRSQYFFPIFEQHIATHNLPRDLMYLAIVESALDPNALSRSGAAGLWQFMKGTAKDYGLRIDKYVDERRDPEKSTKAAMEYLNDLYKRFGDWSLVMAAYNCGPNRLSRKLKKSKASSFWKVKPYLPKETQNYVPAFIGASYLMKFYYDHEIIPNYLAEEFTYLDQTIIFENTSFQEIAILSGVSEETIELLNPCYIKRLIPANNEGMVLKLPYSGMSMFKAALRIPERMRSQLVWGEDIMDAENLQFFESVKESEYKVKSGDNLYNLARDFDCKVDDIVQWNQLKTINLRIGQELLILQTQKLYIQRTILPSVRSFRTVIKKPHFAKNYDVENRKEKKQLNQIAATTKLNNKNDRLYQYHQLGRRESLSDIPNQYPGLKLEDIMQLNNFTTHTQLKPGMQVKIKQM